LRADLQQQWPTASVSFLSCSANAEENFNDVNHALIALREQKSIREVNLCLLRTHGSMNDTINN